MKIEVKNLEEPTRIAKYLAQNGVVSRRKAESLIEIGKIKLDGQLIKELGTKVTNGQLVELDLDDENASVTIIINKPIGYVSAQAQKGEKPAIVLVKPKNCIDEESADYSHMKIPALGRLDKDSHGLLLLSNDGVLAKNVISPDSESEKEYVVEVKGTVSSQKIEKLRYGLSLDGRKLKKAIVEQIDNFTLRFVLKEGRNRQIRRMCAMLGLEVIDLKRVRIGHLKLGEMKPGQWRVLTENEKAGFRPKPK